MSDTMRTKREFYEQAILELNLDVRDPFTNLLANAFALVDQRDKLKAELAEAKDERDEYKMQCEVLAEKCTGLAAAFSSQQSELAEAKHAGDRPMTTTVKIEAHCSETKEVIFTLDEGEGKTVLQRIRLLDGEKAEVYAYDFCRITVFERVKE